ncbi:cytochrome P450 [Umezawaea sp. Da 62-37]|uniref:cytochrome P450 n=1 Tax=Umezawaea sp. Da 62-37 TaxID=3075927 RepID=UPI0028F72498|nr:cytochrome P450 [Umezawaea sp. Da 62-37]WNV88507.1 cytochrome P450 [Umezawaea sp. Da 62-37]
MTSAAKSSLLPEVFSMEYYADPFPTLAWLREHDPVAEVALPFADLDLWLVTRHDDVRALSTDPRLSADTRSASERFLASGLAMGVGTGWEKAFVLDPPDHTRQRRVVGGTLTPRVIAGWESVIADTAATLLDAMAQEAEPDLLRSFGYPLAITTIGTVLGAPQSDHAKLRAWSDAATSPDRVASGAALLATLDYVREQIGVKRGQQGDDLLSLLLRASEGEDTLDEDEVCAIAANLLGAAYDTTANFFANAVVALLDHPDQLASTIPDISDRAVEELLRHSGPVVLSPVFRFAFEPIELRGATIPKGATVGFMVGAANRDPAVYDDPDSVRITRTGSPHVSFGHGAHHCVGASLARLEARIGLTALFTRFPDLGFGVERSRLAHRISPFMYGFDRLPVTLG